MNVKYFRKMYCTIILRQSIFGVKTCSAACIVAVIVCMCSVVPPKLALAIVGLPISSVDRTGLGMSLVVDISLFHYIGA